MGVGSSLIYAPGFFRRDSRADRARHRGGQMRRHVYQPHTRRRSQAARGDRRAGGDLGGIGRSGRNLSFQAVRPAELGQDRRRDRPGRGGAGARPQDHRRHVHLSGELDRPRRLDAALGPGGRDRGLGRAAQGPGAARPGARRDAPRRIGGQRPGRQGAFEGAPPRLQEPGAEAAHRQDPRGGGAGARQDRRGDRRRPHRRGQQPDPGRLFLDERGQCPPRGGPALDELRLRRLGAGAGGRVPEVEHPSRAPTAISPGCSANMSATRRW